MSAPGPGGADARAGGSGSFEFVEGPTSDLALRLRGPTPEALFAAAADGFLAATVEDPDAVRPVLRRELRLEEPDLELLLLRFVNELVWLRDASELLLRVERVELARDGAARLHATLAGEPIDRERHVLRSDVKAATAHGLGIRRVVDGGYEATLTLDV
jgi:tRNA nucleotidyltransferase (CCA-adding enzyme)